MFLQLCVLVAVILIFVSWELIDYLEDIRTNKEKQINCAFKLITFLIIFFFILCISPNLLFEPIFKLLSALIATCFVYSIVYIIYKIVQKLIDM